MCGPDGIRELDRVRLCIWWASFKCWRWSWCCGSNSEMKRNDNMELDM
jgi:hypothetical protein